MSPNAFTKSQDQEYTILGRPVRHFSIYKEVLVLSGDVVPYTLYY